MEYLRKSTFGYSVVKDEDIQLKATHVALTYDELEKRAQQYEKDRLSIEDAMKKNNELIRKYNVLIGRLNSTAKENMELMQQNEEYEQKLEETKEVIKQHKEEIAEKKYSNAYLQQRLRERTNSERKIVPKKDHTGYIFISSQSENYRYRMDKKWEEVLLFKTVFQTPYPVEIEYDEMSQMCFLDFFETGVKGVRLADLLGLSTKYQMDHYEDIVHEKMKLNEKEDKELESENIMTDIHYRANGLTGYWELSFKHYYWFDNIPDTMKARRKGSKSKKQEVGNLPTPELEMVEEENKDVSV